MPLRDFQAGFGEFWRLMRAALKTDLYSWVREMPMMKRVVAWIGILLQGYAIYCLWTGSLAWPLKWPNAILVFLISALIYIAGSKLIDGMLTSELVRKTQLEADLIAARQIQQGLTPAHVEDVPGYKVETFYKPLRAVGGDYFDVIDLGEGRTLFAVADVSGKGMPAALLAANIQALVRSIAAAGADPLALAGQMNRHLSRYTPIDRFATAVFILLHRESGELTYVNAGHNAPMVASAGSQESLEATGMPLGLFSFAEYTANTAHLPAGGALLLFTDGLTDAIAGENAEGRLREALADGSGRTMEILKSQVDPNFNEDDVTILLVKRDAGPSSSSSLG
jgi:sigma-B regulation protein RsbU (phosphoserine phosphatase)